MRKELQNITLQDDVEITEKPLNSGSGAGDGNEAAGSSMSSSLPKEPEAMEAGAGEPAPSTRHNTTVLVMLGMAGAGKTAWTQRFAAHLLSQKKTPYIINLDPACEDPPFPVNIGKYA